MNVVNRQILDTFPLLTKPGNFDYFVGLGELRDGQPRPLTYSDWQRKYRVENNGYPYRQALCSRTAHYYTAEGGRLVDDFGNDVFEYIESANAAAPKRG